MCSPTLLNPALPTQYLLSRLTLIDSQLSPVTWADWFSSNALELPGSPHPSYDRASLAISEAVDGLGVMLESTRLARRSESRRVGNEGVRTGRFRWWPYH